MAGHVERARVALQSGDQLGLHAHRAYRLEAERRERMHRGEKQIDPSEQRSHAAAKVHPPQKHLLIGETRQCVPGFDTAANTGPYSRCARERSPRARRPLRRRNWGPNRRRFASRPAPATSTSRAPSDRQNTLRLIKNAAALADRRRRGPSGGRSDPEAAMPRSAAGAIVRHGFVQRRGIGRVGAGDGRQKSGYVRDAARHRSNMVKAGRKIEHAVAADASPGGLKTGQAVGGRRPADRAAGVGGERAEAQAGRQSPRRVRWRRCPANSRRSRDCGGGVIDG